MIRFLKRVCVFPFLIFGFNFGLIYYLFTGKDFNNKASHKVIDLFLWSKGDR